MTAITLGIKQVSGIVMQVFLSLTRQILLFYGHIYFFTGQYVKNDELSYYYVSEHHYILCFCVVILLLRNTLKPLAIAFYETYCSMLQPVQMMNTNIN